MNTFLYYFARLAVMTLGFIWLILGLGLGVTMVMLPVGFALAILGILTFMAGLFGWRE
jgi:hypothetical protein